MSLWLIASLPAAVPEEVSMYEAAMDILDEPRWIKERLPISYVAEKAGLRLISDGTRLSAVCPFHEDHDPSMDVYQWNGGERFGCWSCGASGDVLDFIGRMWPRSFREVCEMAKRGVLAMEQEGWKAPVLSSRWEWDETAAVRLYMSALADEEALYSLIQAKGWMFPPSHLINWGVRVKGAEVLIPLTGADGNLYGMKHRRLTGQGSPISLPGSKLREALYGEHDAPWNSTLLVEGESDAWTASWLLRGQRINVLGLPAGAGAAPTRLAAIDHTVVYIAFDGDEAGRSAASRWSSVLPQAYCLDMPAGHDITSISAQDPSWLISRMESHG